MSFETEKVWKCDFEMCGHRWWKDNSEPPDRCAGCKKKNWNKQPSKPKEPAKPKAIKRVVEKPEPEVDRTEQVKESLPEKARVLIVSSPKCPACRTPLVPFGTSKRCEKCERNF